MSEDRFFARSASDKTDDWPFWFVADRAQGGLNVTKRLVQSTFLSRQDSETVAKLANRKAELANRKVSA